MHRELFADDLNRYNIFILGAYASGPYGLMSTSPVRTLEDMKGLKVRGTGIQSNYIKRLGGIPVGMRLAESYEGLMRGTIDASVGSLDYMRSYGFWDVCKYFTRLRFGSFNGGAEFTLTRDWFNSLPKVARRAIVANYPIALAGMTMEGYVHQERKTKQQAVEEKGVEILSPAPDLDAELQKIIAEQVEDIVEIAVRQKGVNKEKATKIASTYLELYEKWDKLANDVIKDDLNMFEKVLRDEIYNPFLLKLGLQ